jgi:spermidine synthase
MISHVPMAVLPAAKNILIIGGGDGGTARELLRYERVEKIDLVDIDEMVSRAARKFFPKLAVAFDDKRLNTYYEDGIEFVKKKHQKYDLIIIDSTDPIGPGEGLFTSEFYRNCAKLLTSKGALVNQSETAQWDKEMIRSIYKKISAIFPQVSLYQAFIPTYPSGHWLFSFASKNVDPVNDFNAIKWEALGLETKYYNAELHRGAFALPNFIKELTS